MIRIAAVFIATLLVLCPGCLSAKILATVNGVGPVRIGMTVAQAEKALGKKFANTSNGYDGDCWQTGTESDQSSGVDYMIESGRISRIEIFETDRGFIPDIETLSGLKIGMTADDVRKIYSGRIIEGVNFYDSDTPQFELISKDSRRGIEVIISHDIVAAIYVGELASIRYPEGCL